MLFQNERSTMLKNLNKYILIIFIVVYTYFLLEFFYKGPVITTTFISIPYKDTLEVNIIKSDFYTKGSFSVYQKKTDSRLQNLLFEDIGSYDSYINYSIINDSLLVIIANKKNIQKYIYIIYD